MCWIPHLGKMWSMLKILTFQPHPLKIPGSARMYIHVAERGGCI